ncbi:hypothetical protein Q8F55_004727 [Vanrija albida]|uniref:Major facilitator superfamily (MFS) profile domain-containing protein n=1 Tax=Vanrija albida TaxID=181172 RepID=A0ABR3PZQ5_9TREE
MALNPSVSNEKRELGHLDHPKEVHTPPSPDFSGEEPRQNVMFADIDEGYDPAFIRSTIRKVDLRLVPVLSLMYCISLIDRTNLGLARQANNLKMHKQLDLSGGNGQRFSIATLVFFIPYIILEIPSQLGLRKFGARWWLGIATILWGVVTVAIGFSPNWQTLAGLRALLGVFEATLFPGAAFLIACWYPRRSMALRMSTFYILSVTVSGFGAAMAYGLSMLDGRNGHAGWTWIFIVQGIITIGIGILSILFLVDFPDKATFLTEEQKELVITRIQRDRADAVVDPMTKAKFFEYLGTAKLWLFAYMFMCGTVASYSLAYFLPRILAEMGFSNMMSQLLVVPPYVWCLFPAVTSAYIADKVKGARSYAIVFNICCLIAGTAMYSQISKTKQAARYAGVFLAIGGSNSFLPLVVSWSQTAIRAQSKRGYASALIIAFGGVGGIVASVAFQEKEAAKGFPSGIYLTLAMNAANVVAVIALRFWMKWKNSRADQGLCVIEGNPDFRYQL